MKWKMAAAALLTTAGGALAQGADKGAALDAAQARLTACFERYAAALDDRTSDAGSVARAVLASCSAERSSVEEAARGFAGASAMNAADRARVRDGLIDRATAVVLVLRRSTKP